MAPRGPQPSNCQSSAARPEPEGDPGAGVCHLDTRSETKVHHLARYDVIGLEDADDPVEAESAETPAQRRGCSLGGVPAPPGSVAQPPSDLDAGKDFR